MATPAGGAAMALAEERSQEAPAGGLGNDSVADVGREMASGARYLAAAAVVNEENVVGEEAGSLRPQANECGPIMVAMPPGVNGHQREREVQAYHNSGFRVRSRLQGKRRCGPWRASRAAVDADLAQIKSLESDEQKVVALASLVREAGAGRVRRGGKAIG